MEAFNRQQWVQYMTIKYGVPQSTVLGSILFNLYVNDLFEQNLGGEIVSFANDTVIFYQGTDWSTLKNEIVLNFSNVIHFFNSRLLSIIYKKAHFLAFTSYTNNLPEHTLWEKKFHKINSTNKI